MMTYELLAVLAIILVCWNFMVFSQCYQLVVFLAMLIGVVVMRSDLECLMILVSLV
jgi:hypothetical protein